MSKVSRQHPAFSFAHPQKFGVEDTGDIELVLFTSLQSPSCGCSLSVAALLGIQHGQGAPQAQHRPQRLSWALSWIALRHFPACASAWAGLECPAVKAEGSIIPLLLSLLSQVAGTPGGKQLCPLLCVLLPPRAAWQSCGCPKALLQLVLLCAGHRQGHCSVCCCPQAVGAELARLHSL